MHSVAYGRDENGNLTSATDALSSGNSAFDTSISYDLLNRPTHVAEAFGVTQDYQYDAADNRTQVVDNQGGQTDSTYDDLNRLTTMMLSGSGVTGTRTTWGYDAAGDMAGITKDTASGSGWSASGSTDYHYDDLGRNDAITQKNGTGTTVGAYTFTLDLGDRLTASKYATGSVTSSHSFGYDDANRLKSADGVNYSYDKAGNPTGTGYVTGVANRMTSDGVWTYTYDDAGQMTGKSKSGEAWTYAYDYNGQMVSASKSATVGGTVTDSVAYMFDALGNRLSRVQSGGTSKTERFAYDGSDAFLDLDGSNAVTERRQYGPGVDNLLSRQAGGTVEWYGTDAQGSVRQVFDNTGAQTSWADYEAHGALVGGSQTDRYGFTGRELDGLTGQQYNRARVLDGQTWTSEDPMGFGAGDANLRRYGAGNPTTGRDPSELYIIINPGTKVDSTSMISFFAVLNNLNIIYQRFVFSDGRVAIGAVDAAAVQAILDEDTFNIATKGRRRISDHHRRVLEALIQSQTNKIIGVNGLESVSLSADDIKAIEAGFAGQKPPAKAPRDGRFSGLSNRAGM